MKSILKTIITCLIFIILFYFSLKNTQDATLYILPGYEKNISLILLLCLFFIGGAVLGALALLPTLFRYRRNLSHIRQELKRLESIHQPEHNDTIKV